MFTQGQATLMRNALNSGTGGRSTVRSATNLTNVGADGNLVLCEAQFSADRTSVCPGEQIQFTDETFNAASGWTWTFDGGVPASSNAQNPVVTYSTPGVYSVTLAATHPSGNDTETKTAYIRVVPAPANIPMLEGFETYTTLNGIDEWEVYNPNGNGFEVTTTTGLNSAKSARLMNHGQSSGSIDQLISSPVDLSGVSGTMTFSYRYAYKRRTTGDDDVLRVLVTNDCGESWTVRNTRLLHIVTPDVQSTSYTPASDADWTTVHVTTINSSYFVDNFRYKFEFESGGGNNIYLDNINIYQGSSSDELVVGLSDIDATVFSGLNLFPNPTDDELNVQFTVETPQDVVFKIQDLTGKVALTNLIKANSGSNHVFMNTSELAAGVYFLEVQVAGMRETRQFIVK
jgi:PKD repeat protein